MKIQFGSIKRTIIAARNGYTTDRDNVSVSWMWIYIVLLMVYIVYQGTFMEFAIELEMKNQLHQLFSFTALSCLSMRFYASLAFLPQHNLNFQASSHTTTSRRARR